ncbi:MAG: hypothetical protein SF069_13240 [Phycisphaerae bacterium]|nr:hypothetical protein [Phycisphaerae bacterium]
MPAARANEPDRAWTTPAREALELLRRDEVEAAQSLAASLLTSSTDPRARAEASAVVALSQLTSTERTILTDARAALTQLEQQLPDLLQRPDCELALGRAAIQLGETNSALHLLDAAAKKFEQAGEKALAGAALVGLATAWARHGEWELTGPPFVATRPRTDSERYAIRTARLDQIAQRLADLKAEVALRDAVEYQRACLPPPAATPAEATAENNARLRALAAAAPRSTASSRAALDLAERELASPELPAPTALLEAAAKSEDPQIASAARARLEGLTRTSADFKIDVDRTSRTARITPAWRNAKRATLELLAIDPRLWLADRAARFNLTTAAQKFGRILDQHTWPTDPASALPASVEPVAATVPPGLLLIARLTAFDSNDRPIYATQLVSLDPLDAELALAGDNAAAWALDPRTAQAAKSGSVSFWMAGSYVATGAKLAEGAAAFALPAEARLTNDPRWVALVEADGMIAVIFGRREAVAGSDALETELLAPTGSPRPGEQITITGVVRRAGRIAADLPAEKLRMELRDAVGRVVASAPCEFRCGLFEARLGVERTWSADVLRTTLLLDGRVIPQRGATITVTPAVRRVPLHVKIDAPGRLPTGDDQVQFRVEGRYPWGVPVAAGSATEVVMLTQLPSTGHPHFAELRRLERSRDYSFWSRAESAFRVEEMLALAGPTALLLRTSLDDGGVAFGVDEHVMLSDADEHTWLVPSTAVPAIGQPMRFRTGRVSARPFSGEPASAMSAMLSSVKGGRCDWLGLTRVGRDSVSDPWIPTEAGDWSAASWFPGPVIVPEFGNTTLAEPQPSGWTPPAERFWLFGAEATQLPLIGSNAVRPGASIDLTVSSATRPAASNPAEGVGQTALRVDNVAGVSELVLQPSSQTRAILALWPTPHYAALVAPGATPTRHRFTAADRRAAVAVIPLNDGSSSLEGGRTVARPRDVGTITIDSNVDADGVVNLTLDAPSFREVTGAAASIQVCSAADDPGAAWREEFPPRDNAPVAIRIHRATGVTRGIATPDEAPRVLSLDTDRDFADFVPHRPSLQASRVVSLRNGRGTVEFPLPATGAPLWVRALAAAPDGRTAAGWRPLRREMGLALRLDGPDQCTVGDRIELTARIENHAETPIEFRAEWSEHDTKAGSQRGGESGGRMAFIRLSPTERTAPPPSDGPITLNPGQTIYLGALFEAAAIGQARPTIRLRSAQQETVFAVAPARVAAPPGLAVGDGAPASPVRLRRTLARVVRKAIEHEHHGEPHPTPSAPKQADDESLESVPLATDEAVESGTLILVRDEVEFVRPFRALRWQQPIPETALYRPLNTEATARLQQFLRIDEGLPSLLQCRSDMVAPGRQVMEYVIQAGRPGVAAFAAPIAQTNAGPLRIGLEPADLRLNVTR